jgi:hypothetical protein
LAIFLNRSGAVAALALALMGCFAASARAAPCPTAPDPAALPDAPTLRQMNSFVDSLGARPTGSAAHARYVDWIREQMRAIPGIELNELPYTIHRWTPSASSLRITVDGATKTLPIAGPIPYSKPTGPEGATAPLAIVPADQKITADNAKGKIVVREANAGSVPNAAFLLPVVSWEPPYDPHNTFDPSGTFFGDFINYIPRVQDLRDSAAAGAKGLLFVKNVPRRQIVDHYEPYEGEPFQVPGLFLGADEGKQITDAIAAGKNPSAQVVDEARYEDVATPSIEATLPGQSPQRIVIDSHTDGTNAAEDNGPVAMIAIARYLAGLPAECRPRTIQFAFSTAHFYQRLRDPAIRDGGAEQLAEQLDRDYDKGTVSAVVVLEHLGAVDYQQFPRSDGGPGVELKPTGLRAIQFIGITPSPALVSAVDGVVRSYDLQRSLLLQGADAPGSTVPAHCSFGGEGTPYNAHLLPTIGVISAPQTLYNPAFGLEGIDFDAMRDEVRAYTELVNRMGVMSQSDVAGSVDSERAQRAAGAPGCPEAIPPPPKDATFANAPASGGSSTKSRCTKRRRFAVHVRAPRGFRARVARVRIGKKTRQVRVHARGRHLTVKLDLRGRPAGVTTVRVTIRGTRRSIKATRKYRLCATARSARRGRVP